MKRVICPFVDKCPIYEEYVPGGYLPYDGADKPFDIIVKGDKGYVCVALESHNNHGHQRDPALEEKINEGSECVLVELLNNSARE